MSARLLAAGLAVVALGCGGSRSANPAAAGGSGGAGSGGAGSGGQGGSTAQSQHLVSPEGSTVTSSDGRLTLEFPPGAVNEATEITITPIDPGELPVTVMSSEVPHAYRLEPTGLAFNDWIGVAITADESELSLGAADAPNQWGVFSANEDGSELLATFGYEQRDGSEVTLHGLLNHFSVTGVGYGVTTKLVASGCQDPENSAARCGPSFQGDATFTLVNPDEGTRAVLVSGTATGTGSVQANATLNGLSWDVSVLPPPLGVQASTSVLFPASCTTLGSGSIDIEAAGYVADRHPSDNAFTVISWLAALGDRLEVPPLSLPIECVGDAPPTIINSIGLTPQEVERCEGAAKPIPAGCTWLSDLLACVPPDILQLLIRALDPILNLSGAARDRLFTTTFPCGEGPVGTTFCASTATPAAGDWVFLMNEFGGELVLDDATGIYQYAFVFDADGIADNNYVPLPEYPGDFFAGTDKWYELLYSPAAGWSVQVRDVRLGLATVTSDARFVIAGNQLGFFVPRSELDGAAPTFRTSVFRHEGDYGLSGGPWSGDYFPLLEDPLLAIATAETTFSLLE